MRRHIWGAEWSTQDRQKNLGWPLDFARREAGTLCPWHACPVVGTQPMSKNSLSPAVSSRAPAGPTPDQTGPSGPSFSPGSSHGLSATDRRLLGLLGEHRVLTTCHLVGLTELPERTVQHRPGRLHRGGLVNCYRPEVPVGTASYHLWLTGFGAAAIGVGSPEPWSEDPAGPRATAARRLGRGVLDAATGQMAVGVVEPRPVGLISEAVWCTPSLQHQAPAGQRARRDAGRWPMSGRSVAGPASCSITGSVPVPEDPDHPQGEKAGHRPSERAGFADGKSKARSGGPFGGPFSSPFSRHSGAPGVWGRVVARQGYCTPATDEPRLYG